MWHRIPSGDWRGSGGVGMTVTTQTLSPDRANMQQFRDWLLEDFYRIEIVPVNWWRAVDEAVALARYRMLYPL